MSRTIIDILEFVLYNNAMGYDLKNTIKFKKLQLSSKDEIYSISLKFLPFSDFNFVSLLSWNIHESTEYCIIYGNILIKFHDYSTNRVIYSLLGVSRLKETLDLIFKSKKVKKLELVPEPVVRRIKSDVEIIGYVIKSSREHYDYIYKLQNFHRFVGSKFGSKRNKVNRFNSKFLCKTKVCRIDVGLKKNRDEIIRIFKVWEFKKQRERKDTLNEMIALRRLLMYAKDLNLVIVGVYYDGILIGFSIAEKVQYRYSIVHFEKVDPDYDGIYEYITQQVSLELSELKCDFINWEQDLGIKNLRISKLSYKPNRFFKKYIIKPA